ALGSASCWREGGQEEANDQRAGRDYGSPRPRHRRIRQPIEPAGSLFSPHFLEVRSTSPLRGSGRIGMSMNQTARTPRLNDELRSVASFLTPWRRSNLRKRGGPSHLRAKLRVERLEERILLDSALGQAVGAGAPDWARWVTRLYHDFLQRTPAASE